jgi:hypothetical protein
VTDGGGVSIILEDMVVVTEDGGVSMVRDERFVVGVTMEEDVAVDSGDDAGSLFISLAYDSRERL